MDKATKIEFIHQLFDGVKRSVLEAVDAMPENWDGWELRHFIADKFDRERMSVDRRRKAEYNNECAINYKL
jgi:hypothetical protein